MSKRVQDELLQIQHTSRDGMLHATKVVSWARSHPRSALHSQFEWNNSKAAAEYRLWQARRLIQMNVIMADGTPKLVSLSFDRPRGGGYRDMQDVISDQRLSEIMLRDALADLQRIQSRYERVRELTSIWTAVKRVRQRALKPRRQLKKAA